MKRFRNCLRAISPVLAVLLMIVIVVIAAVVVYAWTMGYLSFSTERAKEAINIVSVVNDPTDTDLLVYVQNIGEGTTQLKQTGCLYVNGPLVPCTISGVNVSDGVAALEESEVAMLTYAGGAVLPGEKVEIKVTTVSGISTTKSAYPAGTTGVTDVDHFVFSVVSSPQVSGVPFNITISAVDRDGNPFWDYSGINTLTCSSGEISPAVTGNFSYGIWTGEVAITGSTADTMITTEMQFNPSKTGTSNNFTLLKPSEAIWNKTYEIPGSETAYALIATSDGGYAIAGSTGGDFLLVKTDTSGNMEWNRTYGGTGDDVAYSVVELSDGGYVIAGTTLLVKTDSLGNMEWNKAFQGTIRSLVVASDNGYAMAGYKNDDFWLVKTDVNGNMQWNKTYGGTESDTAYRLVKASGGGYAIAGKTGSDFWLVKTDDFGDMEWNQTYTYYSQGAGWLNDIGSLIATSDGGYAIAGKTNPLTTSFAVVKTDEDGIMEWNKTYTYDVTAIPPYSVFTSCSMIETSNGGYTICCNPDANTGGCMLIRIDEQGNVEWDQTCALTGIIPCALVETWDGGYAIAGNKYKMFVGSYECWLIKTD